MFVQGLGREIVVLIGRVYAWRVRATLPRMASSVPAPALHMASTVSTLSW